jgi:riboflavin kinase/FMN adenylyltransferase
MIALRDMRDFAGKSCVAAFGTFDGLHMGHRAIIQKTVSLAGGKGADSLIFTFSKHPLSVLNPSAAPAPLISAECRRELLCKMGVHALVEQLFTAEFASLSPGEFAALIKRYLRPAAVVAGYNYTFGRGGVGDAALLCRLGEKLGFGVEIVPQVSLGGVAVSSTMIRQLLASGRIGEAERMMGAEPLLNA